MEPLRSLQNPYIKYVMKLKKKRFRDREKRFMVEGVRFVEEALSSGWPVQNIVYSPELLVSARGISLIAEAAERKIGNVPVEKTVFKVLAETQTPQGIMALCAVKERPAEGFCSNVLVIDGISDPGNLGTVIRSADAFGFEGVVILENTVDLYNSKTLRSTMGSVFHIPVLDNVKISELRRYLPAGGGFKMLVGVPSGGIPVDLVDLRQPLALVVGSEAGGPSGALLAMAHEKITIPMPGGAESLNAGVAASIVMYEVVKQRKTAYSDLVSGQNPEVRSRKSE